MRGNFVDAMIRDLDVRIPATAEALKAHPPADIMQYMSEFRGPINMVIVQALLGAELKRRKNGTYSAVFKHRLPTYAQSMAIAERLQGYIAKHEKPLLATFKKDKDDMSIPVTPTTITYEPNMTNKTLKNKLIANTESFSAFLIKPQDVMIVAAMGEDARRKANRDRGLIIGGICVVGAAAAGVGGFMAYKHRKAKDEALYQEAIEDGDIPILTDEVEVPPVVDMGTD